MPLANHTDVAAPPMIELDGVTCGYEDTRVLRNVDLQRLAAGAVPVDS